MRSAVGGGPKDTRGKRWSFSGSEVALGAGTDLGLFLRPGTVHEVSFVS